MPVRATLPAGWALSQGYLDSALEGARLFDAPGTGEPAGLACKVTFPETFHLASVRLTTKGFPAEVIDGSGVLYLPVVPKHPVRITVYRDETHDKSAVGEIILGVITAGMSLVRLNPTRVASFTLPSGGGTSKQGSMKAVCRVVSRDAVEAQLAGRARKVCVSLVCLRADAALLGPQAPSVVERAQTIVDAQAALAAQWRRQATWRLSSTSIERVRRCGAGCVRVTVRNHTAFPVKLPSAAEVLDAGGRKVRWYAHGFPAPLSPHQAREVTVRVSLEDTEGPPQFPLVVRVREDRWYEPVPGRFARGGAWFELGASRCGEGTKVLLAVARQKFSALEEGPDVVLFASGHTSHFSFPFSFHSARRDELRGEATAHGWDPCEVVVAVSGVSRTPTFFTVP